MESHYNQLDAHFFYGLGYGVGDAGVGNDDIYLLQVAYLAKAPFAELRRVGQDDGAQGSLHHDAVELRFPHIGVGDAIFQVDAVHAQK